MILSDQEHVDVHWAIVYTLEMMEASLYRDDSCSERTDVLLRKIKRLRALNLKFMTEGTSDRNKEIR